MRGRTRRVVFFLHMTVILALSVGIGPAAGNRSFSSDKRGLPGDTARHALLGAYATREIVSGYEGGILTVERLMDHSTITVFGRDLPDAGSLWAFCDRTVCRATVMYDQSGSGNDAFQQEFANAPLVEPDNHTGIRLIFDCFEGQRIVPKFLILPDSISVSKNRLSVISRFKAYELDARSSPWQIGKQSDGDAIQAVNYYNFGMTIAFSSKGSGTGSISPQIATFVSPPTGQWSFQNDGFPAATGAPFPDSILKGGYIGGSPGGAPGRAVTAAGFDEVSAILIYSAALAEPEMTSLIRNALGKVYKDSETKRGNLVLIGESNTTMAASELARGWPRLLSDLVANQPVRLTNLGVGGRGLITGKPTFDMIFAAHGASICAQANSLNIAVVWPGANDIWASQISADDEMKALAALIRRIEASGCKVVVATEPDRAGPAKNLIEKNRLSDLIRSNAGAENYLVADVGRDPSIGLDGQARDRAYFVDGAHLTPAGAETAAAIIFQRIRAMLPP
jgi:lysophospholipase L1-like esterase